LDKRTSILSVSSSLFRKNSLRTNRSSRTSTFPVLDPNNNTTQDSLSRSGSIKTTGRARADSSSTVLVHRAASNRRSKSQATWRPDLLSPGRQSEVRETSREGTPVPEIAKRPNASRTPSTSAAMDSKRASLQPEPKVEVDSESEEDDDEAEEPAAPPSQRGTAARQAHETRVSSNATSESAAPKKPVAQEKKEKKSKKWKKWVCGKF
jgi:hypothetical protein